MMTAQAKQREITTGQLQKAIPEVQQLLIGFFVERSAVGGKLRKPGGVRAER
jgi:hypothetical protein